MGEITDYLLRFADEASSFAVAQELDAVVMSEDGPRLARYTHRYGLLVAGVAATLDGQPVAGWWVRLRVLDGSGLPESLAAHVVSEEDAANLNLPVWA